MKSAVEMVGSIPRFGKAVLSALSWVFPSTNRFAVKFLRRRFCHRLLHNFRIFWRSRRQKKSRKLGRIWSFGLGIVLASLASSREGQSSRNTLGNIWIDGLADSYTDDVQSNNPCRYAQQGTRREVFDCLVSSSVFRHYLKTSNVTFTFESWGPHLLFLLTSSWKYCNLAILCKMKVP